MDNKRYITFTKYGDLRRKFLEKVHRPQPIRNRSSTTATTKTRTYPDPGICHKSTDPSPPVTKLATKEQKLLYSTDYCTRNRSTSC